MSKKYEVIQVKSPEFERDDFLIRLPGYRLPNAYKVHLESFQQTQYLREKLRTFKAKDPSPANFRPFAKNRRSLRGRLNLNRLDSTIYTIAVERMNGLSYEKTIEEVKSALSFRPDTKRMIVRFTNPVTEYLEGIRTEKMDTSCLALIHYFKDHCRLIFRSSNIDMELIPDLLTINEFFLKPIYQDHLFELSMYTSCASGVSSFTQVIERLENLMNMDDIP